MYRKSCFTSSPFDRLGKMNIILLLFLFSTLRVSAAQSLFFQAPSDSTTTTFTEMEIAAKGLLDAQAYDTLLVFCDERLALHEQMGMRDSNEIAMLYYYQFEAQYYLKDFLGSIESAKAGVAYCPPTEEGAEIKGVLYYKRAYSENELGYFKRSAKSMQRSIDIWHELSQPNLDYLVGGYIFLSSSSSSNGHLEEAMRYLRLAEKVYFENKESLDQLRADADGNGHRYEVILKYYQINLLYKRAESTADSLMLLQLMEGLTQLHKQPEFSVHEQVYYSTSLNHVGTWYLEHKADSLLSAEDIQMGLKYINASIDLIEKKAYPGHAFTFYYNQCKALTYANDLVAAETLIDELLGELSQIDGRRPFFLAQKGLIQAKNEQKDSALVSFFRAIEKVHTGETPLKADFSNFQPSTKYNATRLLLRINEKLDAFYADDPEVQAIIAKLYYLALLQFENSYRDSKFSTKNNNELRQILQGMLRMEQKGFQNDALSTSELLNRTETILNQLAWKRFYQNAHTASLPELDALTQRHLSLRKQLALAKRKSDQVRQDSLEQLIQDHLQKTEKRFANLDLLSDQAFNVSDLQAQLAPHELVLKYLLLDQQLVLFTISRDDISWTFKPWTTTEIRHTQSFIQQLRALNYDSNDALALSELLLPEIKAKFSKLIINPDGLLSQLPFEVLQHDGQFLVESHTVSYTSNLGFIHPFIQEKDKDKTLAIYVPAYTAAGAATPTRDKPLSLLGAQAEAAAISQMLPATVYAGSAVTKEQFFATAPEAGLLHLAMHAVVNNEDPALSHFLFGTGQSAEELLYLEELYALQLKANLAVLSACETGLGKEEADGHMASFQRAFTFSGVPTTVASLWAVPDQATKQIMASFYEHLQAGYPKTVALQKAKQAYLQQTTQPKLRTPFYWAGFVLYGEDGPLYLQPWYKNGYILAGIGLLLLAVIVFLARRNRT